MSVTSKVRLKDVHYNVSKLRSAAWDAPLSTSRAVISDFGTLVALIPDELSLVEVHKLLLLIYSGVGDLLGSAQWGYQGYLHAYWTLSHQLVCLFRDLEVRVFDTTGHLERTYSLGKDVTDGPLMAACSVSHKGFFAAVKTTEGSKILHIPSPTEVTLEVVAVLPQEITCMAAVFAPPSSMEVVSLMTGRAGIRPPTFDSPCLVVGLADGSVRIVPTTPDVGTFAFPGVLPVTRIITSASQKFVALVAPSSKQIEILQTTSIFACAQTRDPTVLHISASAPCPPHTSFDIVWVADDCLLSLCSEASPLLLGGPGGEWVPLALKGLPATKTSEDGALMLFDDGVYNLQKVHPSISSLTDIGRVGPSSIVYYTYERTRNGTLGADDEESLRCLERQLPKVIRVCCTAAEKALFTEDGKKCLGAAMLALDFGDRTAEPDDSDFIDVLKQNRKRCVALIRDLRIQKGLSESLKAWWSVSRLRSIGIPVVVVELCWLQWVAMMIDTGISSWPFEWVVGRECSRDISDDSR
ncbi:MAG: hypothetical protein KVP17_002304 [Porospora cf. gigantea B]|uniref:uncharacterized protein n=1 Tax=Porospora cf. gigantea B TaxID=2853592 RepID=UPI003571AB7F|nr:MAG: hypothetical protein KVP17_002304 [Porospora cf. gigantea B]